MNLLLILLPLAQQTVTPARVGAPLRVFAAIFLVLIFCSLIYALRHLAKTKGERRSNLLYIACAIGFVAVCLLLFLLVKA